jgi:predicted class III extradiol MEMO1 family dioxygenase
MASEIIEDVRKFDENYLNAAKEAKMKDIHQIMGDSEDQYRICGFPPLALFLHAFPEAKGTLIDYDYWDESEQKSGVTFAAIGYQLN